MSDHHFDYGPDPHDEDPPEFNMGMVAVKRKQVADAAYARGFAAGVESCAILLRKARADLVGTGVDELVAEIDAALEQA